MPENRFYLDQDLLQGQSIALHSMEHHHLCHVMRARVEDRVELVNGRGLLAFARIVAIKKRTAELKVESVCLCGKDDFVLDLAVVISRLNRFDTILEKATELGVTNIFVFPGDLGDVKISEQRKKRCEAVVVSAMKQCGRLYLPQISWRPPLEKWGDFVYPAFYGCVAKEAPFFEEKWKEANPKEGCLLFTGPESGFSQKEQNDLNERGAYGVKLHRNVLRADTAPIVALGLVEHFRQAGV